MRTIILLLWIIQSLPSHVIQTDCSSYFSLAIYALLQDSNDCTIEKTIDYKNDISLLYEDHSPSFELLQVFLE